MTPAKILFLQLGRKRFEISSLQHASEMFCAARDKAGTGASRTPKALIVEADGKVVGHISYNGRIWAGEQYAPNATPIYENRI